MGVKHWLFQRTSNVLFVLFGVYLLITLVNGASTSTLSDALNGGASRIFLIVVLVFACLNSILAGWQIAGDYARKMGVSEAAMTTVAAIVSLGYLFIGLNIIF